MKIKLTWDEKWLKINNKSTLQRALDYNIKTIITGEK